VVGGEAGEDVVYGEGEEVWEGLEWELGGGGGGHCDGCNASYEEWEDRHPEMVWILQ